MTFSNPNGERTMPLMLATEQAIMPVTGGLLSWVYSSDPSERGTLGTMR